MLIPSSLPPKIGFSYGLVLTSIFQKSRTNTVKRRKLLEEKLITFYTICLNSYPSLSVIISTSKKFVDQLSSSSKKIDGN